MVHYLHYLQYREVETATRISIGSQSSKRRNFERRGQGTPYGSEATARQAVATATQDISAR
jgi:hypothetical protein